MPIDSQIYGLQQPVKINTPFENLASVLQLRQQQQALQSQQALEQERRAKLAEDAKRQQEDDDFKAAFQNPALANLPRDQFLAAIRQHSTPQQYQGIVKAYSDADEKAATTQKAVSDAKEAAARAASSLQSFDGHLADQIIQSGGDPAVLHQALQTRDQYFPELKPQTDHIRQLAATQGKSAVLDLLKPMASPEIAKTRAEAANAAAELPGKVAQSAVQQQVAAGTVGGLTPEQQAQLGQGAQRIKLEQQRVNEELRHNKAVEGDGINADSPDAAAAADVLGRFMAQTGRMPVGFRVYGKDSAKFYTQVAAKADEIAKASGTDLGTAAASFAANEGSLKTQQKFYDSAQAFLKTADQNSALLEDTLKKIPDVKSPLFNKPLRAFSQQVAGNPDLSQFATYLTSVQNEYAKILTNPNLAGQLTDAARRETQQLIAPDATVPQILASVRALRAEGNNRLSAIGSQIDTIKGRIQNAPPKPPANETPEQRIKRLLGGG